MRSLRNAVAVAVLLVFGFGVLAHAQIHSDLHAAKTVKKTVKIVDSSAGTYAFKPQSVTVKVGTKVVWQNTSSASHTVVSKKNGIFNLGPVDTGKSVSFTFKKKGTYNYFCSIHPYMVAKVVVK